MDDMSKQPLSTRVLSEIERKSLSPKPQWHFLAREWTIRAAAGAALLLGALSTALTLYIVNTSWPMRIQLIHTPLWSFVSVMPFVWLTLLVLGIAYSVHAMHRTRRGYRWNSSWLVMGSILASTLVGALIYAAGLGKTIDDYLITQAPGYGMLSGHFPQHLMRPHDGILVGVLETRENSVVLVEPDGTVVQLSFDLPHGKVPSYAFERPVRLVGTTTTDGVFRVEAIAPLRGPGRGFRGPHTPPPWMKEIKDGERMN